MGLDMCVRASVCACGQGGLQKQETPLTRSSWGVYGKDPTLKKEKEVGTPLILQSRYHRHTMASFELLPEPIKCEINARSK